jgi:hypothetical protein
MLFIFNALAKSLPSRNKSMYIFMISETIGNIKVTLEKITDDQTLKKVSCIDGKGACPPEDCGGVWGYAEFLETVSNPDYPEYEIMREWAGMREKEETWADHAGFNLEEANENVKSV